MDDDCPRDIDLFREQFLSWMDHADETGTRITPGFIFFLKSKNVLFNWV